MDWKLGQTSRKYEVGSGGPGTVSTGAGDHGGVSYGSYQLSSKMGTAAKFVQVMGYSQQFKGLVPGTSSFSAKWKELAKNPQFGEDQHEFIRRTHYQPQIDFLKNKGIDLSKRGGAVQDTVWSTSVQFGGGTSIILRALKAINCQTADDCAIVKAIQNYKIANNDALFKSSSPKVRESTLNRAKNELKDLLDLCKNTPPVQMSEENTSVTSFIDTIIDKIVEIGQESPEPSGNA